MLQDIEDRRSFQEERQEQRQDDAAWERNTDSDYQATVRDLERYKVERGVILSIVKAAVETPGVDYEAACSEIYALLEGEPPF